MFVGCEGQGLEFKSQERNFAHIYTYIMLEWNSILDKKRKKRKKKREEEQIHSIIAISGSNGMRKGWNHIWEHFLSTKINSTK